MQIQIVNVDKPVSKSKGKNSWEEVTVEYIGKQGQTKRQVRSFEGDLFQKVQTFSAGDIAEVTVVKEGKYFNWKDISKSDAKGEIDVGLGKPVEKKAAGNWETAEERAKRQEYIIRQSSISNAIALLGVGSDTLRVLMTADILYGYVTSGKIPEELKQAQAMGGVAKEVRKVEIK